MHYHVKAMISRDHLSELLETLPPRLLRVTASYRIPIHEGEDLVQEAFLALIQQEEEIRNHEAWLVFVVKRQCLMYLRRKRRQATEAIDAALLEAVAEASQDRPEDRLFRADLERTLLRTVPKVPGVASRALHRRTRYRGDGRALWLPRVEHQKGVHPLS